MSRRSSSRCSGSASSSTSGRSPEACSSASSRSPGVGASTSSRKDPTDCGDCAPTNSRTTRPFRKAFTAGMPRMPNSSARRGFASTSTFTSESRPSRAATSRSSTGASAWHGPHHSAQKSTTTGCSRERSTTWVSKVASVTSTASNLAATLASMRALVLDAPGQPLRLEERPPPEPGPGQLLVRVLACGVCRTDLHVVDGELPHPKLPLVPGHQIVGVGEDGRRLGVPWLGWTDGDCRYCLSGRENLCDRALFTGYQLDGGYADAVVADERYCFPLPDGYPDVQAAPLLCAGLIGYRSLRMTGDAE